MPVSTSRRRCRAFYRSSGFWRFDDESYARRMKVEGFCCQVPSRPRLTVGIRQEFSMKRSRRLCSESHFSFIVVIGNY